MKNPHLEEKIDLLPTSPGVYRMYDEDGIIIYIGKAKNLKNRVSQYFRHEQKIEKVAKMVENVANFEYTITNSEKDALILENNLIKEWKPKYNILLKDDKTYPYIKINLKEEFPRFEIARKIGKDDVKYFGPFMCGINVKEVLEILKVSFKVRPCNYAISSKKPRRECLNYHLGLCMAPCRGDVDREVYLQEVKRAISFLNGNDEIVEELLNKKMQLAVEQEDFELALICRDRLKSLEALKQRKISTHSYKPNTDIFAFANNGMFSSAAVIFVRGGKMYGGRNFPLDQPIDEEGEACMSFITQYYQKEGFIPSEVIIADEVIDVNLLSDFFQSEFNKKVIITVPKRGDKKSLTEMAIKNAKEYLDREIDKISHKNDMTKLACERLKDILKLKKYPRRMECYDISHISGVDKVGSMVVFIDGEADKKEYRRFKIKTVEGNNDFASLFEVLSRRLSKLGTEEESRFPMPDLVVIDGGKGQLSSVMRVFNSFPYDIDVISLAEREEEIYIPEDPNPILLNRDDYALRMLQRIRDEAHRFAITFNRNLRVKRNLKSALTEIDGIGKVKRDALVERFNDLPGIIAASIEELMTVDGIGEVEARKIKEYFVSSGSKDNK